MTIANTRATEHSAADPLTEMDVFAPGTTVRIRDEEWLVESSTQDGDMVWLTVRGLRGLVQDTIASFSPQLDDVTQVSPEDTEVVADDSPHYRRSRLWLEAVLRKSPEPVRSSAITIAKDALTDPLDYQVEAVRKALAEDNPRTRILLADAVGLGKTIEIGMILSELVRRGKGERILIVTPRHVLEQTQLELWSRFGLPFVRLDSAGIQRVRQRIPATRNPFTYYPRAIVSIDTLKSDLYIEQIRRQHWDAVVIDESHNLSNAETLNNRLARILAKNTDALILASATPHNGRAESFAELIGLLDPTAITPSGEIKEEEVEKLVIRRHRHSDSVAREVGADWAERKEPVQVVVDPSPAEDAIATELSEVWLHPESGQSPLKDARGAQALFPWTLAKAFLSSPAALKETVQSRKRRALETNKLSAEEEAALTTLEDLSEEALAKPSAKFDKLVEYLKGIGVARGSETRAVVFAERVATLRWLEEKLPNALGMAKDAFAVLYGGLDDMEQQHIVGEFSRASSPLRVLITSDVASEGVNLHMQCHNLIHYDLPWSLIRIEQRNGRIDRYGQKNSPQIAMMVMEPSDPNFSGDIRVLTKLMEREHEAHRALGESSSLMGKHSVSAEEEEIKRVLAGRRSFDDAILKPEQVVDEGNEVAALFAKLFGPKDTDDSDSPASETPADAHTSSAQGHAGENGDPAVFDKGLYDSEIEFLQDALEEVYVSPASPDPAGVNFEFDPGYGVAQFEPPRDLIQRLEVLPQSYLKDRKVTEKVVLATTKDRGEERMRSARRDKTGSSWPDASYLAPLHPVLDWATDRSLAALGRGQIFAVRAEVDMPTVLMLTSLTNTSGAVAAASWAAVTFPDLTNPDLNFTQSLSSASDAIKTFGLDKTVGNPGPVADLDRLQRLMGPAVRQADNWAANVMNAAKEAVEAQQEYWDQRTQQWDADAQTEVQRSAVRERRRAVAEQGEYIKALSPSRRTVRPILVMVPMDWPTSDHDEDEQGRGGL